MIRQRTRALHCRGNDDHATVLVIYRLVQEPWRFHRLSWLASSDQGFYNATLPICREVQRISESLCQCCLNHSQSRGPQFRNLESGVDPLRDERTQSIKLFCALTARHGLGGRSDQGDCIGRKNRTPQAWSNSMTAGSHYHTLQANSIPLSL